MARKRPSISRGEREVVRLVWQLGNASVGQVHEAMPAERKMDYSTVQTYLRRLEEKGYLKSRREGRNKLYSARIRPGTVIGEAVSEITDQLFDGRVMPLVRHLVDDRGISDSEIRELRELVDELDQKGERHG
jgi:predicted transcriptional regulator